ncbi:MAG TPA: ArsA family ATPase, partial [Microthrixaceae bacterium]|nr:ArsA family ATPase [Microthrixaceae bacterium]
ACAADGARVTVMSTDPAHSLSDSFGVALDSSLTEVAANVQATELDAMTRMEENWGEIRSYLRDVLRWAGVDEIEAEELSIIPGLEEIFALTDIVTFDRSGEVDVLIVDCAPTAETIRFLSLPDVLSWYMDRAFPLGRRLTATVGPVVQRLASIPVAGDHVFGAVERMYRELEAVRTLLRDGSRSTARLVVTPEKMVVAEARRTFTYLSLFGYRTDAVIANRILPDEVTDPWFDEWKRSQSHHLEEISEGFAPLRVLRAPLADREVVGVEALTALGTHLYREVAAAEVLIDGDAVRIDREGETFRVHLDLPFATKDNLQVSRSAAEVFVRVGPYRRSILLPESLRRRDIVRATLSEGRFTIVFE